MTDPEINEPEPADELEPPATWCCQDGDEAGFGDDDQEADRG